MTLYCWTTSSLLCFQREEGIWTYRTPTVCYIGSAKGRDYSSDTVVCLGHSCQAVARVDPITPGDNGVYGSGDLLKFQEDSAGVCVVYSWPLWPWRSWVSGLCFLTCVSFSALALQEMINTGVLLFPLSEPGHPLCSSHTEGLQSFLLSLS